MDDLRPATTKDSCWLTMLHEQAYIELRRLYDARSNAWEQGFFSARIAHPVDVYIATMERADCAAMYIEDSPGAIRVESLEVLPEYQRHGVGSACLTWVLRRGAQEGKAVTLQVHKSNRGAYRLYERCGFSQAGENQTHYLLSTEHAYKP